ncbi:hypothetical protein F383_28617 [Gossypium arboreum]|uniref:Uncharacterized protein n=1 Tax=Gossypium arboreum TaxID=29729 RepID=A0A0B0MVD7_GOSAR|nr:hypothetical protein F383_28617 [Gossypium arboreum]
MSMKIFCSGYEVKLYLLKTVFLMLNISDNRTDVRFVCIYVLAFFNYGL